LEYILKCLILPSFEKRLLYCRKVHRPLDNLGIVKESQLLPLHWLKEWLSIRVVFNWL
jgi:hypothetical protein